MRKSKDMTLRLVQLAFLLALVVVLQLIGNRIKIGATSISLVLVPIVMGGVLLGPLHGAFLGLVFGAMTLIAGVTGTDPFTQILFQAHPWLTGAICLGKATAAGFCGGLVYRLLQKKNKLLAMFLAAGAVPVVNTGLFLLGALTVADTLTANFVAEGTTLAYFLIVVCAGTNFIVEFFVNILLAPALSRVTEAVEKRMKR